MKRADIKKLMESGVDCSENYDHVPETPGELSQKMMSGDLASVVGKASTVSSGPAPMLDTKGTPQERLRKMAGFSVNIQNPIGMNKRGEIIKSTNTTSLGVASFGGNNPAIYFNNTKNKKQP